MNFKFKTTIYDRYILKQVLFATLGAILLFTIVWIAPEMLLNTIKETLAGEHTVKEAIYILVLQLPKILGKAFPVGLLLGTLFTFDKLSKDSELTILRAIGLSFGRIVAPIVCLSLVFTFLCFITYDKLIPMAEAKLHEIDGIIYPNIQYIYTQKDEQNRPVMSVIVSNFRKNTMRNIIILDFSRKIFEDVHGLNKIYVAKKGRTYKNYWELYNILEYKISQDGVFVNIAKRKRMKILKGKVASDVHMLMTYSVKRERDITNANLHKYIKLLKKESYDEEYHYMLNKYFQRFLHPFVCVLLTILGCILGFSRPREQRLIGFTIAIGTIFLYYITLPFFDLLAEKGVLHPFLTAIIPPFAFMVAIYLFYKSKDL